MRSWFRYGKWLAIAALLVGANIFFYSSGYDSGMETGAHSGITCVLNECAHRGLGEWVIVGPRDDGRPDAKFHWHSQATSPMFSCPDDVPPLENEPPAHSILRQPNRTDDST